MASKRSGWVKDQPDGNYQGRRVLDDTILYEQVFPTAAAAGAWVDAWVNEDAPKPPALKYKVGDKVLVTGVVKEVDAGDPTTPYLVAGASSTAGWYKEAELDAVVAPQSPATGTFAVETCLGEFKADVYVGGHVVVADETGAIVFAGPPSGLAEAYARVWAEACDLGRKAKGLGPADGDDAAPDEVADLVGDLLALVVKRVCRPKGAS